MIFGTMAIWIDLIKFFKQSNSTSELQDPHETLFAKLGLLTGLVPVCLIKCYYKMAI